jgi:hypothetical protein
MDASNWSPVHCYIAPLPRQPLEENIAQKLDIRLEFVQNLSNFKALLNDCGNSANLFLALVSSIMESKKVWAKLKEKGTFTDESAKIIFEKVIQKVDT